MPFRIFRLISCYVYCGTVQCQMQQYAEVNLLLNDIFAVYVIKLIWQTTIIWNRYGYEVALCSRWKIVPVLKFYVQDCHHHVWNTQLFFPISKKSICLFPVAIYPCLPFLYFEIQVLGLCRPRTLFNKIFLELTNRSWCISQYISHKYYCTQYTSLYTWIILWPSK